MIPKNLDRLSRFLKKVHLTALVAPISEVWGLIIEIRTGFRRDGNLVGSLNSRFPLHHASFSKTKDLTAKTIMKTLQIAKIAGLSAINDSNY